jgi:hypothetical protein
MKVTVLEKCSGVGRKRIWAVMSSVIAGAWHVVNEGRHRATKMRYSSGQMSSLDRWSPRWRSEDDYICKGIDMSRICISVVCMRQVLSYQLKYMFLR